MPSGSRGLQTTHYEDMLVRKRKEKESKADMETEMKRALEEEELQKERDRARCFPSLLLLIVALQRSGEAKEAEEPRDSSG